MGLLSRLTKSRDTPTLDGLDLTATRISRAVSYTASAGAQRLSYDLEQQQREGFAGSALAYRCVQAIASNASALDLVVERRSREGDVAPIPEHPVAVLWNRMPNPLTSARVFKETLWARLELQGESFVYLDRGETGAGPITAMYPIFDPVEVVVDKTMAGTLLGFRVTVAGGRKVALLPAEVLWLRYPHPLSAWGAMAPFRAAQFALDLDGWAKAWQQGELRNGARPDGVVYLGDVEPDVHDAIVADFRQRHEGPRNANRHLFLSGVQRGAYDRIGLTAQEVSYAETRTMNAEEVFLAFGVPRDYLMGGTTFENRAAARATLWSDAIVPKLEVVAGEVDRQLLPDLFDSCRFDVSQVDALRENTDAIFNRARTVMYADIPTVNEGREMVGLPPLPGPLGDLTISPYREAVRAQYAAQAAGGPGRAQAQDRSDPLALHTRASSGTQAGVEREYDRVEAIGERAVRALADRMERVVLKQAERRASLDLDTRDVLTRAQVDAIFDEVFWRQETEDALGGTVVQAAYDAGAAYAAAGLGIGFDVFDPQVTAAMRGRAQVLAAQVTETTRAALDLALLEPGVEAGESIPKLSARLSAVFDDLRGNRATVIARTETVGGFNQAGHIAATASGVTSTKVWMAAGDRRVRDTHRALDGTRIPLKERFTNGCEYPGDPAGPSNETIQCRCVLLYDVSD